MQFKGFILLIVFSFVSIYSLAQDCELGLNEESSEMLIKVFQLNEDQISKMETWQAELEIKTKTLEDEIQLLLDTHPQSSTQELTNLAGKYERLQQSMLAASREADVFLLSTFNKKQYERYLMLCHEVVRRPIKVVPVSLQGTISIPD